MSPENNDARGEDRLEHILKDFPTRLTQACLTVSCRCRQPAPVFDNDEEQSVGGELLALAQALSQSVERLSDVIGRWLGQVCNAKASSPVDTVSHGV